MIMCELTKFDLPNCSGGSNIENRYLIFGDKFYKNNSLVGSILEIIETEKELIVKVIDESNNRYLKGQVHNFKWVKTK